MQIDLKPTNNYDNITPITLSSTSKTLLDKMKKINTGIFFNSNASLVKELEDIAAVELHKILKNFMIEMIEEEQIKDPISFLNQLATILPHKKLEGAIKEDIKDFSTALEEAKDRLEEAKLYLDGTKGSSPIFRSRVSSLLDGIISIIECLIDTFGVKDLFEPAKGSWDADRKSHKVLMLIHLFSNIIGGLLSAALLPLIGLATAGIVISGTIFFLIALSIVWPYIKPVTNHLPSAKNWTKELQKGDFIQGKTESLKEIASILEMKRHPILTGASRVGKTLTAAAFVQAVNRGEFPAFKDKVFFRFNTQDILNQRRPDVLDGGENILNKISNTIGRHKDNIVLILDEIHRACINGEISNQLKTFLEENGEFTHVIGITTDKEYKEHVLQDTAFSLRFDEVKIKSTDDIETIKILGDRVLRSPAKPLLEKDALDLIFKESEAVGKNPPQPATAIRLLKRCINRTGKSQKSPTEQKIIKISTELKSVMSQAAATRGKKQANKENLDKLKAEKKSLDQEFEKEKIKLKKLSKAKDLIDRVTTGTYSSILRINKISYEKLTSADEKELNMYMLQEFLGRSLESYIKRQSEEINLENQKNKGEKEESKLIDIKYYIDKEVIKEEANNLKKQDKEKLINQKQEESKKDEAIPLESNTN